MEIKPHTTVQLKGSLKKSEKKIPRNKYKQKYNTKQFLNVAKAILRGKFIATKAYLKK